MLLSMMAFNHKLGPQAAEHNKYLWSNSINLRSQFIKIYIFIWAPLVTTPFGHAKRKNPFSPLSHITRVESNSVLIER